MAGVLSELGKGMDPERLVEASQSASALWAQRLGYLLEHVGAAERTVLPVAGAGSVERGPPERAGPGSSAGPWSSYSPIPSSPGRHRALQGLPEAGRAILRGYRSGSGRVRAGRPDDGRLANRYQTTSRRTIGSRSVAGVLCRGTPFAQSTRGCSTCSSNSTVSRATCRRHQCNQQRQMPHIAAKLPGGCPTFGSRLMIFPRLRGKAVVAWARPWHGHHPG